MLRYKCKRHNLPMDTSDCPSCIDEGIQKPGAFNENVETHSDIYWCSDCNVPIYESRCSKCGSKGKRVATDLRPVFPEERLLVEIIWGTPLKYKDASVWNTSGNYYLIDGKSTRFSVSALAGLDAGEVRRQFDAYKEANKENQFEKYIERFIECNKARFMEIDTVALKYLKQQTEGYSTLDMFVSFSGGKDSTVTSDLVMRALNTSRVLHIFGDTTLEFDSTQDYVKRFRAAHQTAVVSSANREKNFNELCDVIGPPSRVMRWCCTIFKTGAINRKLEMLFGNNKKILAFYGIRRSESASRSKYDMASQGKKITKQITISPIIDWMDFDVWLYILTMKIDFNDAYRLGFARVGCWCCPNNKTSIPGDYKLENIKKN